MSGLTFDWDDVLITDSLVIQGLEKLADLFPIENIWIRTSSSGEGLHVMIASLNWNSVQGQYNLLPIEMESNIQRQYREEFVLFGLECSGRLRSDSMREKSNLRTSRVFINKNGISAEIWTPYIEVLNTCLNKVIISE